MAMNQNGSLINKYGIPLNHIDFHYVNKCDDPKELKHIIQILESGEEGHYPELLLATESRLRQIKPDASILNRKPCFAQKSCNLTDENNEDVLRDISKWINKSHLNEETFKKGKLMIKKELSTQKSPSLETNDNDNPPVRQSIDLTSMFNSEKPKQDLFISKTSSNVHQESLSVSYSKWDKYDPDVEIMKLDNQEKVEKVQAYKKKNVNSLSLASVDSLSFQDRYNSMRKHVISKNDYTLKPQDLALREKELGNEFFKSRDFEEALRHYNTSISIHSSLEAKNNRAMAFIKLRKYEEGLNDLREVIESDPKNVKAHFRRGSCFKAISMYCLALRSFEATLKYDCNNLNAFNFVKELKNLISYIPPNQLIRVREITRHYDQTVWDIEEPFHVSYTELSELNKESVEYLYEADPYGCLMECVCNLCPWHEWQQRKKKWYRHKIFKSEKPKKRWQFLTSNIVPVLISKSLVQESQKPKRLNIMEINSAKMNGCHTNSTKIHDNRVNGTDIKNSPCDHYDDEFSMKPVSSVHDFLQSWKKISKKNNFELYHKLLRSIKPIDLPKVISANLDEEIMSKFLETLNQKFDPESELDLITEYLTALTKVNRFNLIVKMLDNKVKEGFQPLLKRIHRHTNNNLFLALL